LTLEEKSAITVREILADHDAKLMTKPIILTDKEIEPIAWAVIQPDSYFVFASYDKAVAHRDICAGGDIVPLYRQPNLTDKEIEAIELSMVKRLDLDAIYTLRNLLERIKKNER